MVSCTFSISVTVLLIANSSLVCALIPQIKILRSHLTLYTKTTSTTPNVKTEVVLGGVSDFERWFGSVKGAKVSPSIRHGAFGLLRGLICEDGTRVPFSQGPILTLPKDIVLSTKYEDENWDADLAIQLGDECLKGKRSHIFGYCSLLTRGHGMEADTVPPSAAPHSLRHWTKDQWDVFDSLSTSSTSLVQELREIQASQDKKWRDKYRQMLKIRSSSLTWEQFQWCMEVVHSRAFRGTYGLSPLRSIGSTAVPIVVAAIGMAYMQGNANIQDSYLVSLAAVSTLPMLFNLVAPDKGDAVLLPFIDSANHLEGVSSSIQFNPLQREFNLLADRDCFVHEGDKTQFYISYGSKTDKELLLNYGFLPGLTSFDLEGGSDDVTRRKLAQMYVDKAVY